MKIEAYDIKINNYLNDEVIPYFKISNVIDIYESKEGDRLFIIIPKTNAIEHIDTIRNLEDERTSFFMQDTLNKIRQNVKFTISSAYERGDAVVIELF